MQNDSRDQDQKSATDDVEEPTVEVAVGKEEPGETAVLPEAEFTDNVGDVSVEINIEELVAKVEAEQSKDASAKKAIRQRLEEIEEDKGFESTYAIEFDNE
jgi:predicted FMN-binding regulatory protein PaiB